ncbi:MAG: ABC transporter permease [Clostridia bacterium]|nr:ABC transporter permease [Clostridia bacterium]MBR2447328.1 ABC transporter permease [Clostridia bacterium]
MTFLIQQTLVYTIPLMIVALAGVFAERSGIINIALDGIMIFGSFVGALAVYIMQTAGMFGDNTQIVFLIAMLVAALAGALFSLLLSFSAINLKADQTIGGTALNMLAPAVTLLIVKIVSMQDRLSMPKALGFIISNPDMNDVFKPFFDKMFISTYIVIALFVVLSILLYKTKYGLRLRACGEHPQAADSVGINVARMRYLGTTISGALAGLGGYIYIATTASGTAEGTVAGMGFLALAIMIFGNWKPVGIAFGSLLFGLLKCIGATYASLDINGDGIFALKELGLPIYFYNLVPYVVVLLVLAFTSKKSRAPKAEGIPYDKGQR